jgi:hypothetical protein
MQSPPTGALGAERAILIIDQVKYGKRDFANALCGVG